MRFHSYLRTAASILAAYDGAVPFHAFIKNFFSGQKKFGATDRRTITNLCYCYFRLGKASSNVETEERILLSLLLCSTSSDSVLKAVRPEWDDLTSAPLDEKIQTTQAIRIEEIFPWKEDLSAQIDHHQFSASFLAQPRLFLRIRPGQHESVIHKLKDANISFETPEQNALALPAASKLEPVLQLNKEAVVQDLSSQRVAEFLPSLPAGSSVWDCCSGSGGKSILVFDQGKNVKLTASDKRESIIANLRNRFREAGIVNYQSMTLDLEKGELPKKSFDLIVADVPCSGSGTWARTPEQLFFHQPSRIHDYQQLQRNIIGKVASGLQKGQHLLYITCSVFKAENEDNVAWSQQQFNLKVLKMDTIRGYGEGADTMFAALLTL